MKKVIEKELKEMEKLKEKNENDMNKNKDKNVADYLSTLRNTFYLGVGVRF